MLGLTSFSPTNTDQLSASLETDKTGVWHWNSSQRIKGSILPASPVSDAPRSQWHNSVRWLMLSAFKHWGMTTKQRHKNVQKYSGLTNIKTRWLQNIKEAGDQKSSAAVEGLQDDDSARPWTKVLHTQVVHHTKGSWTVWEVDYLLSFPKMLNYSFHKYSKATRHRPSLTCYPEQKSQRQNGVCIVLNKGGMVTVQFYQNRQGLLFRWMKNNILLQTKVEQGKKTPSHFWLVDAHAYRIPLLHY